MATASPALGIVKALIPVLFCGGFLVWFAGVERWTGVPVGNALVPTIVGLAVLTVLFAIPLVLRIARLGGPPPPRRPGPPPGEEPPADESGGFDADAAIARYLARRGPGAPPPPPASAALAPPPSGFGRKAN